MHTPANIQKLVASLGQQLAHVKTMLDILEREYQALSKRDLTTFDNIVLEKQTQLNQLEQLEPGLAPIQALLNEHPDDKAMKRFTDSINDPSLKKRFESLWRDLRDNLNKCRQQNTINNRIIQSSHLNISQAISILRGENNLPNLYGATGKQDSAKTGQPLAVA